MPLAPLFAAAPAVLLVDVGRELASRRGFDFVA